MSLLILKLRFLMMFNLTQLELMSKKVLFFNANSNDGVIAVGGGSSMDVGKIIAFMAKQKQTIVGF